MFSVDRAQLEGVRRRALPDMVGTMGRRFLTALCLAVLVVSALPAQSQSVLKTARGLQSNEISVLIDQAAILESDVEFAEVSIANPEIADVQPVSNRTIYIFGRKRGTTSLTLFGPNGQLITNVVVKVLADVSELKERLRQLLPGEPVEVRTAADGIILSGVVSGAAKVDKAMSLARAYAGDAVINMLSVGGTQQVMLKVKVAEIARSTGKDIGVSLGVLGSTNRVAPAIVTGPTLRPGAGTDDAPAARPTPTQGVTAPGDIGTGLDRLLPAAGAFAGAFGAIFTIADSFILDLQIDALETKGFARTLSEPNLVSLSGVEASFLAGGEVPIPVIGDEGEITITFKPVGVNLNFLPVVLDNDLINVSVSAEVSQVDPSVTTTTGGIEIVGFQTRRATTTVELRDGQAFAIAGLLQESFEDSVQQVPWLGDIPILGTLFRSVNYQRGQTELVIFVSVHLVTPVDNEADLALPTDRVLLPSEADLFLFGKSTGEAVPGIIGTGFDGDYGYVVE